jgi:hypothetical protein
MISFTPRLLYPWENSFFTNSSHSPGDGTKNLNSIAFDCVRTVTLGRLKLLKQFNVIGSCSLITRRMTRNVLTESDTLTSHPARIRAATTSECPADDARCKAFRPFCKS